VDFGVDMEILRMIRIAIRLAWPHLLAPWRSPLLRWRMETYGIRDAQGRLISACEITALQFFHFVLRQRRELIHFLRWAARL